MVYIYALEDPRDSQIRYVGKTIDIKHRMNYRFVGINNFIRDYLKLDRYLDKRRFNSFSSKITVCLKGRKKQYKNYKFELVC